MDTVKLIPLVPCTRDDCADCEEHRDPGGTAFDRDKMLEVELTHTMLYSALAEALLPFASLLREGHGFGVADQGEHIAIIGFALTAAPPSIH